jgi:hypothetical protein
MRAILICLALLAQSVNAYAIDRLAAATMSCSAIKGTIKDKRAVILRFAPNSRSAPELYDLFANSETACGTGKYTASTTIPSRDNPRCEVMVCRTNWGRRH